MMRVLKNAMWTWVLFQVLAVMMGMAREWVLLGILPPLSIGLLTAQTEVVLVLLITWLSQRALIPVLTRFRLFLIGVFWVGLSALMEALFPHFVLGKPWARVPEPYATLEGRLHGLVVLVMLVAPLITGWRATRPASPGGMDAKEAAGDPPEGE
ncbi:MAG: hypothetical protein OEW39_09450 [Deltaproteobacteria bacterium]|nr:hypothetical protein [Deltaproteobacteria bacterium]